MKYAITHEQRKSQKLSITIIEADNIYLAIVEADMEYQIPNDDICKIEEYLEVRDTTESGFENGSNG